jgi:polyphosphate kinase
MDAPAATASNDSAPAGGPAAAPQSLYFNRELSWLAFNRRVLEEACNPAHPLLERLRFLSISGDNLDEFFMVRVAGLKGQQLLNVEERSMDGLTPSQQLAAIARVADALTASQQSVWSTLKKELREAGVSVLDPDEIGEEEGAWLDQRFIDHIYSILTPQAIDPAHPFPFIPNKGFSLIFDLCRTSDGEPIQELLMVPGTLPRFIRLPGEGDRYVAMETLIRRQIATLFPATRLRGGGAFRIIRDSDIEVEEEAEDLVRFFRTAIKRRRRGRVIRLKLEAECPTAWWPWCARARRGRRADLRIDRLPGIGDLAMLVDADRPDLKFPSFTPRFPSGSASSAAIASRDPRQGHHRPPPL